MPVDYRKPRGASIDLAVIEKPATDPSGAQGVLLFNPGGPGESGVQILRCWPPWYRPPSARSSTW